jgi:metal-responsive CopG/Arc/MetJ family transcriptional regulator
MVLPAKPRLTQAKGRKRFALWLPPATLRALDVLAAQSGRNRSDVVEDAVNVALGRKKAAPKR